MDKKGLVIGDLSKGTQELYNDYNKYLDHMDSIIELAEIKDNNDRDLIIAGLFTKILGSSNAIRILLNNNCPVETEILTRSCPEALFYMGACINSKDAVKDFIGRNIFNQLTYINCVLNNNNIKLNNSDKKDMIKRKNELDKTVKEDDLKVLKPFRAAQIAGVPVLYDACYRKHSEADHSSPDYLLKTFFDYDQFRIKKINILPNPASTWRRFSIQ